MKKRITALLLIIILLLCACGKSEVPVPEMPAAVTEELTPDPTPEPTPEPTPQPTPRPLLEPELSDYTIDRSFSKPASEQGQVINLEYVTHDYVNGLPGDYPKNMLVYLPYGYNENEKYDVLFLAHIRNASEYFWLGDSHWIETPEDGLQEFSIPVLIDNMIERGMCRPLIVIALDGYIDDDERMNHNSAREYSQFSGEFRWDIMPTVQNELSVYDSREHYGFLGASFGAYLDYLSILSDCFDLVGWHTQTGGGKVDADYLREVWRAIGAQDEELCALYLAEGEYDDVGTVLDSRFLMEAYENFSYTVIKTAAHDYREWDVALYNTLQMFFR